MTKRKVLYIAHGHPAVRPGGAETHSLELYQGMRASNEFEPILLARNGPPVSPAPSPHSSAIITKVNHDPGQYFFYTDGGDFDSFYMTQRHKSVQFMHFREFLKAHQPDVVHFQHTLFFGVDFIRETRNILPNAPIVYTLHEHLPMCHRDGMMLRRPGNELCLESSPRRCHECFPEFSPASFFMRKRFIQSHFSLVDQFLAPSRFLLERFVEWGLPREKVRYQEHGRPIFTAVPDMETRKRRNRLGYFGQFTPFKGVITLLKSIGLLSMDDQLDVRFRLHGGNLDLHSEAFQKEFRTLLTEAGENVTVVGRYSTEDLPALMQRVDWVVVPSISWENSPLVIQEAFAHGRPVICSDIGGMAEKVHDGVNGLHFRVGDPESLAETIRRAVGSTELWERLRAGIPQVYGIEDSVKALSGVYRTLLEGRATRG